VARLQPVVTLVTATTAMAIAAPVVHPATVPTPGPRFVLVIAPPSRRTLSAAGRQGSGFARFVAAFLGSWKLLRRAAVW
jgi:hypothetical protein